MYHIKPDKRSQTSAKLIVEGLYQCLEEKPFSRVTITDIQKASSVGRATFYRLFDTLTDVLEFECDNVFRQMLSKYRKAEKQPEGASPFESLFTFFMEYWMEHTRLLDALIDSGRIDIMNTVYLAHADEIGAILVPDLTLTPRELQYFVAVATAAIFGIFYTWMQGGKKETCAELIAALKRAIDMAAFSLHSEQDSMSNQNT